MMLEMQEKELCQFSQPCGSFERERESVMARVGFLASRGSGEAF